MIRAWLFAGQGAQAVGMGRDVAEADPSVAALFREANEILGYDLTRILFEGPIEELTATSRCQPGIFLVSVACLRLLQTQVPGLVPAGAAGLSLGEWTALHAAGVLSFSDAVRVLEARGRFMQEACEAQPGGMVSVIGLPMAGLEAICAATGVEIANLNSPEQTVLSGPKAAIEEAEAKARAAGARKTVVLNVAGAYHSSLMAPAAKKLADLLAGLRLQAPEFPVVSNLTGAPHGDPESIRQAMVRQVTSPVQWVKTIQWFQAAGVGEYIECGPGKVLAGLVKRVDKDAAAHSIQDRASLQSAVTALRA